MLSYSDFVHNIVLSFVVVLVTRLLTVIHPSKRTMTDICSHHSKKTMTDICSHHNKKFMTDICSHQSKKTMTEICSHQSKKTMTDICSHQSKKTALSFQLLVSVLFSCNQPRHHGENG